MITLVEDDPEKAIEKESASLLALRLLCEAWEFTSPNSRMDILDSKGNPVLTIHSPGTEPRNWFDPFDLGEPSGEIAKKIASLMGDKPKLEAVEKLLTTIASFTAGENNEERIEKLKVCDHPDNLVIKTRKALTS